MYVNNINKGNTKIHWRNGLIHNRLIPVRREFKPHERVSLFSEQETLSSLLSTDCPKELIRAFIYVNRTKINENQILV